MRISILFLLLILLATPSLAAKPGTSTCIEVLKGKIIPIRFTATDNKGVIKTEVYVNNVLVETFFGGGPVYSSLWGVPKGNNKVYQIVVLGYDAAGNIGSDQVCVVARRQIL